MFQQNTFSYLLRGLLILSLLTTALPSTLHAQDTIYLPVISGGTDKAAAALLFRTQVTVRTKAQWQTLERLQVMVLQTDEMGALLLVDDTQLADLARLRFNPTETNAVETLAAANDLLAANIQPLLQQLRAAKRVNGTDEAIAAATRANLRDALYALSAGQRSSLAVAATVDSDNDGLTDDQEAWWCTDPAKADSDFDGTKDGAEVTALKAWLNNETAQYPSTGRPFFGWPVSPTSQTCTDGDQDAVPDLAEVLELGLNPGRESTDRDKFDDGQELFGTTYCTGQGGFCSYGPLPRNEDWGVIFAEMPSWVKAPGNHPLVAAFPVPEVDVVASSLKVETVTVVTTDHVISEGTEKSYSTAKTEGTSSAIANTSTWNEWNEIGINTSIQAVQAASLSTQSVIDNDEQSMLEWRWGDFRFNMSPSVELCIPLIEIIGVSACAGEVAFDPQYSVIDDIPADELDLSDVDLDNSRLKPIGKCHIDNEGMPQCSDFEKSTNEQLAAEHDDVIESQDRTPGGTGHKFVQNDKTVKVINQVQVTAPTPKFPPYRSETSGRSIGGAKTTTHTTYEEHTVTNGEAFSNEESWGTATAIDSAHAADLTFTYKVRNTGTEYAREIANLAFNLYIGDDPNPAYTYFVAPDLGGNGKFENFMPNEEHQYTSRRIPLSLEQMKAIDLGGPIRIVVEDFTYGIDELFYQDAANAGLLIALEDGTDDGDETIDTYLIPTWGQETVLDVLARYFPHETDDNGTIIAIWTPEYRSTIPAWCQDARRPTDYPSKAVWCKHTLSTADWWNVYTDGLGDGSEGFQQSAAVPGATALFRFNQDSDLDGFSDRSEARLGTDPDDATSYPRPELVAGLHNIRGGNRVTSTLSLLNRGIYDAYGVEAVMVAPDDSITIENNTVGGSGRVRALNQVIVGSRIALPSPLPGNWTQAEHAVPAAGGYYTGNSDRAYTFTVTDCGTGGCAVGSGSWTLAWQDDAGNDGTLNFAAGYQSPTFLPVGDRGVTLALYSGDVSNGEQFILSARTPRDTFQYTINREPHTAPVVIVSYNDPQGNHRFVLPTEAMSITTPTADLNEFSGQMLEDVGVELVTSTPFTVGTNSLDLLVNNPSDKRFVDAHLFLEFINISGTVVSEVPTQVTLPPGPTYTSVPFDSADFTPLLNTDEDYIVMAFLTDYQGNILDTAGRPLSSFQTDPLPSLVLPAPFRLWDFGTLAQGTLAKYPLSMANVGFGRLYTYLSPAPGFVLTQTGNRTVGAADVVKYEVTLNTADLPVGAFDRTLTIRTSDPANPTQTLRVVGTIAAATPDVPASGLQRPLDVAVDVAGSHTAGEWIEFTHTLGPDPQSLHPVKVYSSDYNTLHGVGEYATDFSAGTASAEMFGDGRDGAMPGSGNLDNNNGFGVGSVSGSAGSTSVSVTDRHAVWRIAPGDVVLLHQTQGSGAGCWELNKAVSDIGGGTATHQLENPLKCTYSSSGNNRAQIMRVPQYSTCNVTGTVTPLAAWNGTWGGIFVVMCEGMMTVSGSINATSDGFRGGSGSNSIKGGSAAAAYQGEGYAGIGTASNSANVNAGGAGTGGDAGSGGGGGGYGRAGEKGANGQGTGGQGGQTVGTANLSTIYFGGGGGGGKGESNANCVPSNTYRGGHGATGGGTIFISAAAIDISGQVLANGGTGGGSTGGCEEGAGGGGGGGGGSIFLRTQAASIGTTNKVTANGGNRGSGSGNFQSYGGSGGYGRIRVEYCNTLTGTTNPPASTQKLNCHIAEQIATSPYTTARLNLPETFTDGRTHNVQFGRKLDFAAAGSQTVRLRIPAGLYSTAHFDALVSGLAADATLAIDVGDNGTTDWSSTVSDKSTNNSPALADVFTAYWRAQGSPTTGTIDVPVKVTLSDAGQVLLTNLQVQTTGSRMRYVQLPAWTYDSFHLDFTLGDTGAVALDIGDDGSIDWSADATSVRQFTGDLSDALNSYLSGKNGTVNVPLRFYVAADQTVTLNDHSADSVIYRAFSATGLQVNNNVQAARRQTPDIQEGEIVPLQATIQNSSDTESGLLTAAFFAHAPGWGDWYIGSDFVENLPAGGTAELTIDWNTTGFNGNVAVKMVVNPYARLAEADYTDNETTVTVAVAPVRTDQSIDFTNPGSQSLATPSLALSATTSSGLNVSFTSLTSAVCTVSGDLVSLVAAGTCTIRATQSGNDFYHPAAAVEQSFAVQKIEQTITFDELPTRMLDDSPFALHAGASSGLEVAYRSLTTTICTVSGDTVTLLKVGTCTIRAEQAGDSRYQSAPEVEQSFTVVESDPAKSSQTITFAALPTRTIGDPPFTVNATVDSDLSLTYTSLTTAICTVSGNTVTLLRAGECTIQAAQAGNEAYNPAAPVSQTFTVTKRPQTISFGSLSDKVLGDEPFVVSASASSGLAVSYSTETPVICTISGTIVTLVTTGRCTIKASQPGSDIYDPAPSVSQSLTVLESPDNVITLHPLPDRNRNESPVTLVATASSGLPVSFVSLTSATCTVTGDLATLRTTGLCTIRASQPGNGQFPAATPVDRTFTINETEKLTQSISFAPLSEKTFGDSPFALVATATSGLPVAFYSRTSTVCTVDGTTVTLVNSGVCTIRAEQAGNDSYNPAPLVEQSFAVQPPPKPTIEFGTLSDQNINDSPITISATVSSGPAVIFTSLTQATCIVSGNEVTLKMTGICTIRASQPGDNPTQLAEPVERSFRVLPTEKPLQVINFSEIGDVMMGSGEIELQATATSGLAVTYLSITPEICTVAGNVVTPVAPGECEIQARQDGDDNYAAAEPVTRSFEILESPKGDSIFLPSIQR